VPEQFHDLAELLGWVPLQAELDFGLEPFLHTQVVKFVDLCYGVLPSRHRLVEHLIHQLVLTATRLQGFKVPIPALRVSRRRQQRQEVESLNLGRCDSYFPRDHLLYVRAVQHIR
jgi:hypothetical protein